MAAKKAKTLIRLVDHSGYFKVRKKNFKTMGDRKLRFRMFDPTVRGHVWFDEKKIK